VRTFRLCEGATVAFDATARTDYLSMLDEPGLRAELSCNEDLCAQVVRAKFAKEPFKTTIGQPFARHASLFGRVNRELTQN
jgi:hypothetical protein